MWVTNSICSVWAHSREYIILHVQKLHVKKICGYWKHIVGIIVVSCKNTHLIIRNRSTQLVLLLTFMLLLYTCEWSLQAVNDQNLPVTELNSYLMFKRVVSFLCLLPSRSCHCFPRQTVICFALFAWYLVIHMGHLFKGAVFSNSCIEHTVGFIPVNKLPARAACLPGFSYFSVHYGP